MTLCWPQWYQIVHLMMDTIDVCIASATIQYTIFISNQHSNIVLTGRMQKLSFQLSYRKSTWNLISVGKWFLINPCESMHERYHQVQSDVTEQMNTENTERKKTTERNTVCSRAKVNKWVQKRNVLMSYCVSYVVRAQLFLVVAVASVCSS